VDGRDAPVVSLLRGVVYACNLARMDARRHLRALPDTDSGPELLTIDQVGGRLHCSRRTVFRLIGEQSLLSIKVGRRRMVLADDVNRYIDTLRGAS
jgi:excisionase family DNA binding protein